MEKVQIMIIQFGLDKSSLNVDKLDFSKKRVRDFCTTFVLNLNKI